MKNLNNTIPFGREGKNRKKELCVLTHVRNRFCSLSGFTLVEILTVFTIMVMAGYALSVVFKQSTKSYTQIRASQEIVDIERSVVSLLTRDLENAYVSQTDTRFRFMGTNTALHFNSFQENSSGIQEMVEIGYTYDNALNQIDRRLATGTTIPDADVTSGGTSSPLGRNIYSLSFRIGYKSSGLGINYISSGSTWDSRANTFANYNKAGEGKNPDGLPHLVEVTFTVTDTQNIYPQQTITTTIYLPHDK